MHFGRSPFAGTALAGDPLGRGLDAVAAELGDKKLGDLDGPALAALALKIRTAAFERAYVSHVAAMSFMMPGAGQFVTGDAGMGAAFMVSQLAVVAGSVVGSYFLLPADLRFDKLDYLGSPISAIKTTWDAHSIADYLPSVGIMAAGMLVDMPLRFFAAKGAAADAQAAIKDGRVKLETRIGPGFMGWRYRF
jgi:hypothetical protein